jgi:hypothetical protein
MMEGRPSQTHSRRGNHFRGIAANEWFLYEIMWLCLVLALTRLHDPLNIGGRSTHKRKDDQHALCFDTVPRDCQSPVPTEKG